MDEKPGKQQEKPGPAEDNNSSNNNNNSDETDLSEMEAQLAEMLDEQKMLNQIQKDLEEKMSLPPPPSGIPRLTPMEMAAVDARSVYVGNVDYAVAAADLEAHFRDCGLMNRVTIPCDRYTGHPKGFAYVEFKDKASIANAVMMSGSLLRGRPIKVTEKRTNRPGMSTTNRGGFGGRGRGLKFAHTNGFVARGGYRGRGTYLKHYKQ